MFSFWMIYFCVIKCLKQFTIIEWTSGDNGRDDRQNQSLVLAQKVIKSWKKRTWNKYGNAFYWIFKELKFLYFVVAFRTAIEPILTCTLHILVLCEACIHSMDKKILPSWWKYCTLGNAFDPKYIVLFLLVFLPYA